MRLMVSKEEVIFYKEAIESPQSCFGHPQFVSGSSSLVSGLEWPSNKEESTSTSCHGLPVVGEHTGSFNTPVQPILDT